MIDILKSVAIRLEEAVIDINEMKSDLKFINLKLQSVEKNTEEMKQDINDLIETSAEILSNMVGQKEFNIISEKVIKLEKAVKTF